MGSIGRRLEALERRSKVPEDEARRGPYREMLRRLTDEELAWLGGPLEEAEALVECPIHGPGCECRNEERGRRAHEEHPRLVREHHRRYETLLERAEEIAARGPAAGDRKGRHGTGARASPPARGPAREETTDRGRKHPR